MGSVLGVLAAKPHLRPPVGFSVMLHVALGRLHKILISHAAGQELKLCAHLPQSKSQFVIFLRREALVEAPARKKQFTRHRAVNNGGGRYGKPQTNGWI